jgi:hypothetical protein
MLNSPSAETGSPAEVKRDNSAFSRVWPNPAMSTTRMEFSSSTSLDFWRSLTLAQNYSPSSLFRLTSFLILAVRIWMKKPFVPRICLVRSCSPKSRRDSTT